MPEISGETLRVWRRSRGWDVPELARQLRKAAGNDPLPVHDALVRMIYRWERLGLRTERYELLYRRLGLDEAEAVLAGEVLAGSAAEITQASLSEMLARATLALSKTPPVTVTLKRVLYHPEGITLDVSPAAALGSVFEAAQATTREAVGTADGSPASSWMPHMTLCYSTSQQAAAPVIAALGKELPGCEVTIDKLSLVIQRGPELLWDWHPVGAVGLLGEGHSAGRP